MFSSCFRYQRTSSVMRKNSRNPDSGRLIFKLSGMSGILRGVSGHLRKNPIPFLWSSRAVDRICCRVYAKRPSIERATFSQSCPQNPKFRSVFAKPTFSNDLERHKDSRNSGTRHRDSALTKSLHVVVKSKVT